MVEAVTVNIEGIGPVLFEINKQAKHIQIIDKASKGICVEVPPGVSFNEAIKYVNSKIGRVQKPTHTDNQNKSENKNFIDKPSSNSTFIEIPEIGSVLLEHSKRAKYLNVSVKPFRGVRVAVPYGTTSDEIHQFISENINWIKRHLAMVKQVEQGKIPKPVIESITRNINGIGKVLFERNNRIRSIKIYTTPAKSIKVVVPDKASFEEAEEFVLSKLDLIKKQFLKMKHIEQGKRYEPKPNSKIKKIPEIGAVQFIRSEKATRMIISVKPFEGVSIAVPKGTSFRTAKKLINSKIDWIKKHQAKVKLVEQRQKNMSRKIAKTDIPAANERLFKRLKKLAKKHGFNYNNATIRHQKTRWGSCSSKNNINLNISLALLPPKLTDYVILHELVHTRIKNHSKNFWAELDKYVDDSSALRKEMKNYRPGQF